MSLWAIGTQYILPVGETRPCGIPTAWSDLVPGVNSTDGLCGRCTKRLLEFHQVLHFIVMGNILSHFIHYRGKSKVNLISYPCPLWTVYGDEPIGKPTKKDVMKCNKLPSFGLRNACITWHEISRGFSVTSLLKWPRFGRSLGLLVTPRLGER